MKIAVLGPKGTYSDIAAHHYNEDLDFIYFRSINEVFKAIDDNTLGIIPYENSLDGFVQNSMDLLLSNDITIIDELYLPISFSALGYSNKVKRIIVQFKAKGQCMDFINQYPDAEILLTESNMISMELLENKVEGDIAIVPSHIYSDKFLFHVFDVTDRSNNQTRFLIVKKGCNRPLSLHNAKATLAITLLDDAPGQLYSILSFFYKNNMNLVSIVSRPTKSEMGKYNFFIDVVGFNDNFLEVITDLEENKSIMIKILGLYENSNI